MGMRRGVLLLLCLVALGLGGAALLARERMARCAYVPLLAAELLPAPDFTRLQADPRSGAGVPPLPAGWSAPARGVQVGSFTVSGSGRSFQLIGIGNAVQAPQLDVRAGDSYCVALQAIADSPASATRLRVVFDWRDRQGATLAADASDWQPVRRWQGPGDGGGWSPVVARFRAPADAAALALSFHPASDDRVYIDDIHVRRTTAAPSNAAASRQNVAVEPWPKGYQAALSFSFDWETAMGGLIHSRSDDPNAGENAILRAMRMREGVTSTLELFRPYGIRATYYANGYNFLFGNPDRRRFMGDPTFAWATRDHRWLDDTWARTPWFARDPYGTVQSDPAWYFGDLIALLQRDGHDIQSHTFSHLDGGLADAATWRADLEEWRRVAAGRSAGPARSLAFPWSSSAGMSYANWDELERAGITSVTRTNWTQPQYRLASYADPHCAPVPGHERILACPDFYLHSQETAAQAIKLIDTTIAAGGTIDLWAHTEEVTSPEQIAAWHAAVSYAAQQRDAGKLWIAPLAEIADWQAAVAEVSIANGELKNQGDASMLAFTIFNGSKRDLSGVTLKLPFQAQKMTVDGTTLKAQPSMPNFLQLDIRAGQTLEVQAWPI